MYTFASPVPYTSVHIYSNNLFPLVHSFRVTHVETMRRHLRVHDLRWARYNLIDNRAVSGFLLKLQRPRKSRRSRSQLGIMLRKCIAKLSTAFLLLRLPARDLWDSLSGSITIEKCCYPRDPYERQWLCVRWLFLLHAKNDEKGETDDVRDCHHKGGSTLEPWPCGIGDIQHASG